MFPLTIEPEMEVSHVGLEYDPVEYKPLVTVAALPVILIPHDPEAPVPVGEGTSVPITKPRLVRAPEAVVEPVPPFATATVPVTLAALPLILPLTIDPEIDVNHVGLEYDTLEYNPLVTVAAFPVIEIPQVPEAPVPVKGAYVLAATEVVKYPALA
jgi:hypothetical protein